MTVSKQETQLESQQEKEQQIFDIVISGGGLSGLLMAQSLASLKHADGSALSIAIVEATAIKQDVSLTFDDRVLALAHSTCKYLDQLGVWQHLANDATAIKDIHISDRGHYGKARIKAQQHNVDALGYVIEMALIGKALYTACQQHANIHWYCPDKVSNINWQKQQVNIRLDSGTQLQTKLLLACDGGQSACRDFANIGTSFQSYEQHAVIANVSTEFAHQHIAYERFTEFGPIAMLPLSNGSSSSTGINPSAGRMSLVWSLTPEEAERVMQLDDKGFANALNQAFGNWLGQVEHAGQRFSYPLVLVKAEQQTYHRMALVGNASHTIHPIAGQGFNLGVRDVQLLARLIEQMLLKGEDIGRYQLLNQYETERDIDHKEVINLTDSLVSLFSNQHLPLVVGRNIGVKVMNYCMPLQQKFVNKTMGY